MTTGGHMPRIIHQSPATVFARRMMEKGFETKYNLSNMDALYNIYDKDFPPLVKKNEFRRNSF